MDPIRKTKIEMQTQRTDFGHSRGRRGWDELRTALEHILPYAKEIASGKLLYNAGSSKHCSVTT